MQWSPGALMVAVCLSAACEHRVVKPAETGSIRGMVKLQGDVPEMPPIDFSSNPQCEREHPKPVKEEAVIVGPDGGLANAFVWIKSGLPNQTWDAPATAVKLDQSGCVYKPHVLGIMVNQEFDVTNSDPVNHDVHMESRENEPSNASEPPRSDTVHRRFVHEEVWFPVTCGVHPWMRSYVAVVPHPYFAVTGARGTYELKNVPPGRYVVETVHEKFGRKEQVVTLGANERTGADFMYGKILR